MTPPDMPGWNLTLRFGLELAALVGLASAGWRGTDGPWRWIAAIGLPLVAALLWTTCNVPGDPSRSGEAPVEVGGGVRLALELAILTAGAAAFALSGSTTVAIVLTAAVALHYLLSTARIEWLLR